MTSKEFGRLRDLAEMPTTLVAFVVALPLLWLSGLRGGLVLFGLILAFALLHSVSARLEKTAQARADQFNATGTTEGLESARQRFLVLFGLSNAAVGILFAYIILLVLRL